VLQMLSEQMHGWFLGWHTPVQATWDERVADAYLQRLGQAIDVPVKEATVSVEGLHVQMLPGQIGRRLDRPATLDALRPSLLQLYDADVTLVVQETLPLVLDASEVAAAAQRALSAPLTLTAEGEDPWTFTPTAIANMMHFDLQQRDGGTLYTVDFDLQPISDFLEQLAPDLVRKPENARFIFNDDTRQLDLLRSAVIGRTLDITATLEAIRVGLIGGQHDIPLVFQTEDPAVTDSATAEQLGITEAVSVVSTYFSGSSSGRISNIKLASGAFHGMLIAPGETLSMADVLGEVSLDTGYAEAWIILGNRTIKGAGGGVCQVSTTLFRAAFFGGYEIVERHPHAYRVGYYEQGPGSPGPGLDATVFVPAVDFKFKNDTPYWLLMETYVYGNRQLQWKFYSTSDGRQVSWHSSGPRNVVEAPPPLYRENPDLPTGKIVQVDWAADGMDVTVTRTVTRGGVVIHDDTFRTHYAPWQAIYEYGPGTELPPEAQPTEEPPPEEPPPPSE
jgi:vancomycin resistance protein YoaR